MIFYLTEVQQKIGYEFKDVNLLRQCFTHSSYAFDNNKQKDNERLEFLGDSILGYVVTDYLYRNNQKSEGCMTEMKQGIVSTMPLSKAIIRLGVEKYMLKNEKLKITDKMRENMFEAIVAGIYLDGGLEEAKKFIIKNLVSVIKDCKKVKSSDFKSQINEYSSKNKLGTVKYKLKNKSGSDHEPIFEVQAILGDKILSEGIGDSKKEAEQKAAEIALKKLKKLVKNNA